MAERLPFLWTFTQIRWHHLKDSGEWLFFTILGSLVPVWVGSLLYLIAPGGWSWNDIASHGELALYSAALLAPAIYLAITEKSEFSFPGRALIVLIAIFLLLVSLVIFAGITVLHRFNLAGNVKEESVALYSVVLYAASAIVAFIVDLFDNFRRTVDVRKLLAERQKALEQKFDQLG